MVQVELLLVVVLVLKAAGAASCCSIEVKSTHLQEITRMKGLDHTVTVLSYYSVVAEVYVGIW